MASTPEARHCIQCGMRVPSTQRGHTFLELLLAMGLFGIIVLVMNQFSVASLDGIATIYAQSTIQTQGAIALSNVMSDARQAVSRQITGTCTTYAGAAGAPFIPGPSVLCLSVPSINSSWLPLGIDQNDTIIYDLNAAANPPVLRRTITAGPGSLRTNSQQVVASYVIAAVGGAFPATNDSTVVCSLLAQNVQRGRTYTVNVASRARLRNQ